MTILFVAFRDITGPKIKFIFTVRSAFGVEYTLIQQNRFSYDIYLRFTRLGVSNTPNAMALAVDIPGLDPVVFDNVVDVQTEGTTSSLNRECEL